MLSFLRSQHWTDSGNYLRFFEHKVILVSEINYNNQQANIFSVDFDTYFTCS